ncbi:queuosine precursor transporter [Halovenus halobia]|uniref:queuosine precursor transporter n=1 Tax=Halovenus halobia TaxID=3396622 RepID=UPI003F565006
MNNSSSDGPKIALAALFITSLVTAQLIAVKLLVVPFPSSVPIIGGTVLVPAGVLAYAVTFFASDCYAELYGRRPAQLMVNIGFAMNFVLLALVWVAIAAPGSPAGVDPAAFKSVLGLSTNIVVGSLAAYIVSQNWDVIAFHAIGDYTDGESLWLRNIGSTGTSQLIDTTIFVLMAFLLVPSIIGTGQALGGAILLQLIFGQYVIKLLIALLDTPFVYAMVGYVRSAGLVESRRVTAD